MTEKLMPAHLALQLHFENIRSEGEIYFFSGFMAALRGARGLTARDLVTGEKTEGDHGNWLGAIGYLILLDQIGKCFKPLAIEKVPDGNPISVALKLFSTLEPLEIDAIYALRCSFAHDFSLSNIPKSGKKSLYHFFLVHQGADGPLIRLPKESWDGNQENKNQSNQTAINLELLGDLVDNICIQLKDLAHRGEIETILPGGTDELIQRYSFWSKKT